MISINNQLFNKLDNNNLLSILPLLNKVNIKNLLKTLQNKPLLLETLQNNQLLVNKDYKKTYNLKINKISSKNLNLLSLPKFTTKLPSKIDLRNKFGQIYNQGDLGSCTANALCGLICFDNPGFYGSRLFLYYNERKLEFNIPNDSGALLSDGIRSLIIHGICLESDWVYDIKNFATKPPLKCYIDALKHRAIQVSHIMNDMNSIKTALINNYPFVVGISVYESFESDIVTKTGYVPMPKSNEKCLGGHAVVCVGFDDSKQIFIMRNSWGPDWGEKGYFYLPYLYLLNESLASDLWCINKIN